MIGQTLLETVQYQANGSPDGILAIFMYALLSIFLALFIVLLIRNYIPEDETYIDNYEIIPFSNISVAVGLASVLLIISVFIAPGIPITEGYMEADSLEHVEITSFDTDEVYMNFDYENIKAVSITTSDGKVLGTREINSGELKGSIEINEISSLEDNLLYHDKIRVVVLDSERNIIEEETLSVNLDTKFVSVLDRLQK